MWEEKNKTKWKTLYVGYKETKSSTLNQQVLDLVEFFNLHQNQEIQDFMLIFLIISATMWRSPILVGGKINEKKRN